MKRLNTSSIILVDMDGTICNFNKKLIWLAHTELGAPLFKETDLTLFRTEELYPPHLVHAVGELSERVGFFEDLEPIPGAIEALMEMRHCGYEVFICTTPKKFYRNRGCAYEKQMWVMKHLGKEWTERVVLTRDKTLVSGSVLIDDKPEVVGACCPSWTHVYYDQPYNREDKQRPRIISWSTWKEVVLPFYADK